MAPRLIVVCLGGLAGAGALVCCDMDEDIEALEVHAEDEATDVIAEERQPAEADPAPVH
jgi:hypothetical protein